MTAFTCSAAAATALATAFVAAAPLAHADIRIGLMDLLTGFVAADGKSAHEGAKLAAQANAKGGVNGEKIAPVVYDDQASPKEAVPAATKLIQRDKVVGGVLGSYSASTWASAGVFQNAKVPYVTAYAIHPDITRVGDYMFRVSAMDEVQGRADAKLVNELGKKKVALITVKNDFGQAVHTLRDEGMAVLLVEESTEHALGIADDVCVLESGGVVWRGSAADACNDPNPDLAAAYLGLH